MIVKIMLSICSELVNNQYFFIKVMTILQLEKGNDAKGRIYNISNVIRRVAK